MSDIIKEALSSRIRWTHAKIISLGEALTEAQFARQPGPTSPPIGWHVWHASRWADRFQASFQTDSLEGTYQVLLAAEIWKKENPAQKWGLRIESFGLLETGATMSVEAAVSIASVGKSVLIDYARRVFDAAEQAISFLDDKMLTESRCSILPRLEIKPDKTPGFVGDRDTTVFDELLFHATHAGRHLGMMEALRGALFEVSGSVSM
jgi:hypothetical protein